MSTNADQLLVNVLLAPRLAKKRLAWGAVVGNVRKTLRAALAGAGVEDPSRATFVRVEFGNTVLVVGTFADPAEDFAVTVVAQGKEVVVLLES